MGPSDPVNSPSPSTNYPHHHHHHHHHHPTSMTTPSCRIALLLNEKRTRRGWWGKQEDVCWEQWVIEVEWMRSADDDGKNPSSTASSTSAELQFEDGLGRVWRAAQRTDHIPPITTSEGNPFPFQIVVPSSDQLTSPTEGDGWGAVLKKMLEPSSTVTTP